MRDIITMHNSRAICLAIVALLLDTFSLLHSQGWRVASAYKAFSQINDISFSDAAYGAAVGANGLVVVTTDNGENWISCNTGVRQSLAKIIKYDGTNIQIVGDSLLLASSDEGLSWQRVPIAVNNKKINDGFFVLPNTIWVVGNDGIVLSSTNGGASWIAHSAATSTNLNKIFFINSSVGIIVGDSGVVLRTLDGGVIWNLSYVIEPNQGSEPNLTEVIFHGKYGLVNGDGALYESRDSGKTWIYSDINNLYSGGVKTFSWPDSNHLFESDGSEIITIFDSGFYSRIKRITPLSISTSAIYFSDSTHGWVGDYRGVLMRSDSAGYSWALSPPDRIYDDVNSIQFVSDDTAWAAASKISGLTQSVDSGATWKSIWPQSNPVKLEMKDGMHGWICDSSVLYSTNDGWKTRIPKNPSMDSVVDFHFEDMKNGVILYSRNSTESIARTSNGGNTWADILTIPSIASMNIISGFSFLDSLHIWVLTGGLYPDKIWITSNGGGMWDTVQPDFLANDLSPAIQFVDPRHGWIFSQYDDTLWGTTDAGSTWSPLYEFSNFFPRMFFSVTTCQFIDSTNGWVGGVLNNEANFFLQTADGGKTWHGKYVEQQAGAPVVNAFQIKDINHRWACGRGCIWKWDPTLTGVMENFKTNSIAKTVYLYPSYPNPFNVVTSIPFFLLHAGNVSINVFDVFGRKVKSLFNGELSEGSHILPFNAQNLPDGSYFYRLQFNQDIETGCFILNK